MQYAFSYYHYIFNRAKLKEQQDLDFMDSIQYTGPGTSIIAHDYRKVGLLSFMKWR